MQGLELFAIFTQKLDQAGIEYMVTGSVASIIYGEPRVTHDIDMVLELTTQDVKAIPGLFPIDEFYCPPAEIIAIENHRPTRGHFNLIHHETGFKADIYPAGQDPLHTWGLKKKRTVNVGEYTITLAPPEYVIVRKLQYFREGQGDKHIRDIRKMIEMSNSLIDYDDLNKKVDELGLVEQWEIVSPAKP